MSQLHDFKISGRTAASTDGTATGIIATKSVSWDSDGFLRYTDANSKVHMIPMNGALGALLLDLFTGTGGLEAGGAGVQGERVFGQPKVKQ